MSKLSKAVRGIRFGPIVDWAVRLAERLLGRGAGALKKKLVEEIVAAIVRVYKSAGKEVPENVEEIVEELIEATVGLLNESGELDKLADYAEPVGSHSTQITRPVAEPTSTATTPSKRRGRPPGSKNLPKPDVRGVGPVALPAPMFDPNDIPEVGEFDEDLDFTEFDLVDDND